MNYILRPALGTAALLLIPFLLMQFQVQVADPGSGIGGVNWTLSDFVVAGVLLFTTGLLLEAAWRSAGKYRALAIGGIIFLFLWLWAELAVGLFTNWGS
jgi:hypothetical protein